MQSILRNCITEQAPPAPQHGRRVSFHTDRAPKPISKVEKGEWSVFRRPSDPAPDRLGERTNVPEFTRFSRKVATFTRTIIYTKPHPRIFSKPRRRSAAPPVHPLGTSAAEAQGEIHARY